MKRGVLLVLVVGILASAFVLQPATATECENNGGIAGGKTVPVTAGDVTFYVEVREVLGDAHIYSIWIYQETNGLAGLQRGGTSPYFPDDSDPCNDPLPPGYSPDTIIF